MKFVTDVRTFARKNPIAVVVGTALALVILFAAIETSGMLPLAGQAMPMYGPLPIPGQNVRKVPIIKPPVQKPMTVEQRRAARLRNLSSASSSR